MSLNHERMYALNRLRHLLERRWSQLELRIWDGVAQQTHDVNWLIYLLESESEVSERVKARGKKIPA